MQEKACTESLVQLKDGTHEFTYPNVEEMLLIASTKVSSGADQTKLTGKPWYSKKYICTSFLLSNVRKLNKILLNTETIM